MAEVLAGLFVIATIIGYKVLAAKARNRTPKGPSWNRPTILLAVTAAGAVIVALGSSQSPEHDALQTNTVIRKLEEGGWQTKRRDSLSEPKGEELTPDAELLYNRRDKVKESLEGAGYTVVTVDPVDLGVDGEDEDVRETPSEEDNASHPSPSRKKGLISVFE